MSLTCDAVFEGGGVKGVGLVGAVAVTEQKGYSFANVAGTSAGAIIAALVAAGYTASELREIMMAVDYSRFKDKGPIDRIPLLGPLGSLIFRKGIYQGRFFEGWMRELLAAKGVSTFGDLVVPGEADPRFLYKLRVVASDLSRERMLVLPQDLADYGYEPDDVDVAWAVRMSMSIPYFFEPVKLKHKGTGAVSYVVDGGLLSNYPVSLFDTDDPPPWPTFGYLLVEDPGYERHPIQHRIFGPVTLFVALFGTMMDAHDKRHVEDADFVRTIPIPTLGVKATDFDLSKAKAEELHDGGVKSAERFFEAWDFGRYVAEYRAKQPPSRRTRLKV